jgi:hypothetical protein
MRTTDWGMGIGAPDPESLRALTPSHFVGPSPSPNLGRGGAERGTSEAGVRACSAGLYTVLHTATTI